MKVELLSYPGDTQWAEVYHRALVTIGKNALDIPSQQWRRRILRARHSPIRYLNFSFYIECPYWVAMHLCRHHVGAQPYVRSQRNDRQFEYDRNAAPQDATVSMILDLNGEAVINLANKRLCGTTAKETRDVVRRMCELIKEVCPEYTDELVPMCVRNGYICHEMKSCKEHTHNMPSQVDRLNPPGSCWHMKRKPDPRVGYATVEELYRLFPEQSNRKIARAVGVRPYTLTDWLNGQSPSAAVLARLHYLGADVIYILTGVRN